MLNMDSGQSEDWLQQVDDPRPVPPKIPAIIIKREKMPDQRVSLREKILMRRIMREGPTQ